MGCTISNVNNKPKLLKNASMTGTTFNDASPQDREALKDFNILPTHFVRKNSGIITDDYTIHSPPIGKGAFGEVRRATHNASGLTRAIKIIAQKHAEKDQEEVLMNEVSILRALDHPNIMKVLEFYKDEHFFYIVSEYCGGGDLYERMKGTTFSEARAAKVIFEIISGVNYLHLHGIVHRDLKPENILYESHNGDANTKIADFGVSRALKKGMKLHSTVGTILYIAPEVLRNSYNEKCDIWSCGVILFSLLFGRPPFFGRNEAEIEARIAKGVYSIPTKEGAVVSKEAKMFLQKLLAYNPQQRYSASEALKDSWFKKILFQNRKLSKKDIFQGQQALTNLANFHAGVKFQDAVWVFLVNYFLGEKDKKVMMQIFQDLDENHDGLLTKDEVLNGYKKYDLGDELGEGGADEIINRIDRNKNGSIDYTEFLIAAVNKKKLLAKSNLEATFKLLDKDGSKSVTAEELKDFFAGQNAEMFDENVWEALMREVDENSDGEMSLVEFKNIMSKLL